MQFSTLNSTALGLICSCKILQALLGAESTGRSGPADSDRP